MTKTLTYLLLLVSTLGFSQNKSLKDSSWNSYGILTSNRVYINEMRIYEQYEKDSQHDITSQPSTNYYISLRHLYFGLDSSFMEVLQYPDMNNMNPSNDLYPFKDTCYLKESMMIGWEGHFSILSDTIYLRDLNLVIYDGSLAISHYNGYRFSSPNNLSLFKQYFSMFEICRFDSQKTRKFVLKNSELYDTTGKKWFGFK